MQKPEFDFLHTWLQDYRSTVADWGASGRPESEIPLLDQSVEALLEELGNMESMKRETIDKDGFTYLVDPSNSMLKHMKENQGHNLMGNLLKEIGIYIMVSERSYGINVLDYDLSEIESVFWEPRVVRSVAVKMASFVAESGLKERIEVRQVLEASKAAFLQVFENDGEKVRAEER